jgi:type I restriction enzyme, S subunit
MEAVTEDLNIKKYISYRDSGTSWLGEIPKHWSCFRMKYLFKDVSQKNKKSAELLSVTQHKGVVPRSWVENRMVMPSGNLDSFKYIKRGDFAISLRSFEGGLEYCHHDGIISPAYTVLRATKRLESNYFKYLFKSTSFISELQTSVVGIREGKNISYGELAYSLLPLPPITDQTLIARFLDRKTAQIDKAIAQKERLIELLKERRQILLHNAVTRGLNPNVRMKDCGIEWIGRVPEHWMFKKAKWLFERMNRPIRKGDDIVTCFRDGQVTLRIKRKTEGFTNAEKEHGYQGICVGDLVIHAMDAFAGAIGVSDSNGKSSPVYSVCSARDKSITNCHFYAFFLREIARNGFIQSLAKGIRERSTDFRFSDFAQLMLPIPPIEEQDMIVAHIEKTTRTINRGIGYQEDQIAHLEEYKSTLINSAVTGKLKVPDIDTMD